jgi:arylsulfatase A-like enzyme
VQAATTRPNIVVILSDDQRWDSIGSMTNVQRLLAAHGVTFTNSFVTTSLCCPSRASILTGRYSHHTGVVQNFGPRSYPAFDDTNALPVWLSSAGYETALVGKYLNDYPIYGHERIPPGWSKWWAVDSRPETRYYDYVLNENGRRAHYGVAPSDYSTTVLGGKATGFVRQAKEPFFLYFAPIAVHQTAIPAPRDVGEPLKLPPPRPNFNERDISDKPWRNVYRRVLGPGAVNFIDRSIEGRQLRTQRELDRQVGALVRTLAQRGLLDHTIIVFASDNGFLWGEHRLGGKIWPYEESIRVPLVVRVPWQPTARTDAHLVTNVDFASTIAGLAGVTPGLPQDGRSLVPLLHGRAPPWRKDFPVEYLGVSQLYDNGAPPFRGVRTTRWLYVEYRNGWHELYDLRRDPYELRNLAKAPSLAAVRARLAARVRALAAA